MKCRPPGNRDPQPDEIEACSVHLRRQLEVLDPAVVVTVGKHSLNSFRPGERIGATHGTAVPADPRTGAQNALAFAMYHPAFALYQSSNKQTLVDDMNKARGSAKTEKMAAVINELVSQRSMMQKEMMTMQPQMMDHMMEHMKMGMMKGASDSMADCPMMKESSATTPAPEAEHKH